MCNNISGDCPPMSAGYGLAGCKWPFSVRRKVKEIPVGRTNTPHLAAITLHNCLGRLIGDPRIDAGT